MRPPNKYNTVFHFQSKNVVKKIVQIFLLEVLCMYVLLCNESTYSYMYHESF